MADDYQRDYELMQAWARERPHRHDWHLDVARIVQVCACGVERDFCAGSNEPKRYRVDWLY